MNLFVFGLGYTAEAFLRLPEFQGPRLGAHRVPHVAGTVRSRDKAERLTARGIPAFALDGEADPGLDARLREADAILVTAPPEDQGDPTLLRFGGGIAEASRARWIGYLSTTGIYGDRKGAWVDESTEPAPSSPASARRLAAERAWLDLGRRSGIPVHIFRLSGIYGPGRNALAALREGTARRIVKQDQVFNRIHVADIATCLAASLARPRPGAVYNLADDEPAPPQDVVAFAARLAGVPVPPDIPYDTADLSPAARSFYAENKRVANRLIKEELGVRLACPTYREGIEALYRAGEFAQLA